jgi:transcriptional regulator CtsR
MCSSPLNIIQSQQLIKNMQERNLISSKEAEIIKSAVSGKALNNPINIENVLRANIMKQIILSLMKG